MQLLILRITHTYSSSNSCFLFIEDKTLDSSKLNTLRCQLGAVKLIVIDEISVVGNNVSCTDK